MPDQYIYTGIRALIVRISPKLDLPLTKSARMPVHNYILTFNPMTKTLKDESKCTLFQSSLKNVTKVLRNIPFIQFRIFVTQQSQIRLGIFFLLLLQIKEKDFADLLQDICHLCLKRSSRL